MTRKKTKRSSSGKRRSSGSKRGQNNLRLLILIILLVLAGYYLLTGSDPLGLFEELGNLPAESSTPAAAPPQLVGRGGDWWQVYFTDPQNVNDPANLAGSIPEKLIEYINEAQDSIYIAAFEFDLDPVAEALVAAQSRGVTVQWVTDDEHGIEADQEESIELLAGLEKEGIEIREDGRSALMHNKFWIFDNQTVWTGSTNVTRNGNFRNNNNVIIINSAEIAAIYKREFDELWKGEFGPTSPSTVNQQMVTIDGTPVQVLFAAEDQVINRLVPLINGAQKSIHFMAFSFTNDALGEAVLNRARAGVQVQGIFETRGSETEFSELSRLYCANVPVRQDGNPGTFHHKVFIIDDQMLITGSLNFSDNADQSNDENVVIITNQDIAAEYLKEFERRWAEATEPESARITCSSL